MAIPMSLATAIMLADGWHQIAPGSLTAVISPVFTDSQTGDEIAPGDDWVQFAAGGTVYACPMRSVAAVQLSSAVQPPPAP